MTNTEVIDKIMSDIPKVKAESDQLDKKHKIDRSLGIKYFDENAIRRHSETNVEEEKLERFLYSLPPEQLLDIETIMYFGRSDNPDITDMRKSLKERNDSPELRALNISSKLPALENYFTNAFEFAREKGIDLNNF